jgi:hypothetical protein
MTIDSETQQIKTSVANFENILLTYDETNKLIDNRLSVYAKQYNKTNSKVMQKIKVIEKYENVNEDRIKKNNEFLADYSKILAINNNIVDGFQNDLADVKTENNLLKKELKNSVNNIRNSHKNDIDIINVKFEYQENHNKKIESSLNDMTASINILKKYKEHYENTITEIENKYLDKISQYENLLSKFEKIIKG